MVKYVGRFNVDYAGAIYDGKTPYEMVIISEVEGNKELARKTFYFRKNDNKEKTYTIPTMETEEEVERWFRCRQYAKFCVFSKSNTYGVKAVKKYV